MGDSFLGNCYCDRVATAEIATVVDSRVTVVAVAVAVAIAVLVIGARRLFEGCGGDRIWRE